MRFTTARWRGRSGWFTAHVGLDLPPLPEATGLGRFHWLSWKQLQPKPLVFQFSPQNKNSIPSHWVARVHYISLCICNIFCVLTRYVRFPWHGGIRIGTEFLLKPSCEGMCRFITQGFGGLILVFLCCKCPFENIIKNSVGYWRCLVESAKS